MLDELHLLAISSKYLERCNKARGHLAPIGNAPDARDVHGPELADVLHPGVGGLHHRHERTAMKARWARSQPIGYPGFSARTGRPRDVEATVAGLREDGWAQITHVAQRGPVRTIAFTSTSVRPSACTPSRETAACSPRL